MHPPHRHRRGGATGKLRPRVRPGRAERQQALDRGATAFRHAQIAAAGCGRGPAEAACRPAHDQGRRDRDPRPALPHPGAQPRRRHRPPARTAARGRGAGRRRGGRPSRPSARRSGGWSPRRSAAPRSACAAAASPIEESRRTPQWIASTGVACGAASGGRRGAGDEGAAGLGQRHHHRHDGEQTPPGRPGTGRRSRRSGSAGDPRSRRRS